MAPAIDVRNTTSIGSASLAGAGPCVRRLAEPLILAIARRAIAARDPQVANLAEERVESMIEDQVITAVDQVNALVRRLVWDVVEAHEVMPGAHVETRSDCIRASAEYRTAWQLAAFGLTPFIGKACTFFVDRSLFDMLSRIPPAERLGDLRLMTTPADMALAVIASCSEPTYFDPIPDWDQGKLLCGGALGDTGTTRRRSYCGGWIQPIPAQDIRRMLPQLRVFGTGRIETPFAGRHLLKAWYLVESSLPETLGQWWLDLELLIPRERQKQIISGQAGDSAALFEAGRVVARAGLATDADRPAFVLPPVYGGPLAAPATVDPGNPRRVLRSTKWTKAMDGFVHGQRASRRPRQKS